MIEKATTPVIRPTLVYRLRSIDWNEDFCFENPIDKEEVNSFSKALEIAQDIFRAIERSGMQYRENYRWDEHLYFKTQAENILAATIYYYCKHFPEEYCNLAYIIATVCNPDITILMDLLSRDRETEVFVRGMKECHDYSSYSEYTGIRNELTTYLARLYTKEFLWLFKEGEYMFKKRYYDRAQSQRLLEINFLDITREVERLPENYFKFHRANEETFYVKDDAAGLPTVDLPEIFKKTANGENFFEDIFSKNYDRETSEAGDSPVDTLKETDLSCHGEEE